MQVQFFTHGLRLVNDLQTQLRRRLEFALDRYAHRVQSVDVRVVDENGPKGGVDKRCTVTARLGRMGTVVITDHDSDVVRLVDRVAHRASMATARKLGRQQVRA
jgi:hypothetical protein